MRGFTCGMDDLLLLPAAERSRASLLAGASTASIAAAAKYVGLKDAERALAAGKPQVRRADPGGAH